MLGIRCRNSNAAVLLVLPKCLLAAFLALIISNTVQNAVGQQPAAVSGTDSNSDPAAQSRQTRDNIKRWFELETLNFSFRYRHITNNVNLHPADVGQFQFQAKGRFKFDKEGKYSVYAGVYTGNSITSGWGSTGWGTGGPQTNLYLKQLYFDAKPIRSIEIQFGGIAPTNGENTEVTGYDNDLYIMGERVSVRNPKKLYFDEVSFTNAHLGDITRPSVFRRFKRLDESNYHQVLVRKRLNKNVAFSADYTFDSGRDTFRQAIKFSIPRFHVFDTMRFENYQQVDPGSDYGFGVSGEKKVHKDLTLNAGFSRIDTTMLNGDRYGRGNRVYAGWNLKLLPEISFNGIWIQAVGPLRGATNPRTRVDVILTFNILEALKRLKLQ